jgi:hypothetical protein
LRRVLILLEIILQKEKKLKKALISYMTLIKNKIKTKI